MTQVNSISFKYLHVDACSEEGRQNYKQLSSGNKMEVYRVKIVLKDCRFYCGDKTVLRIIIINV